MPDEAVIARSQDFKKRVGVTPPQEAWRRGTKGFAHLHPSQVVLVAVTENRHKESLSCWMSEVGLEMVNGFYLVGRFAGGPEASGLVASNGSGDLSKLCCHASHSRASAEHRG